MKALGLALLPAAGNFIGGLLAENFVISDRTFGLALHLAAGVVLAVVAVELVPDEPMSNPVDHDRRFLSRRRVLPRPGHGHQPRCQPLARDSKRRNERATALGAFLRRAFDLFSDGVMVGTGSSIALGLGLLLALAQMPADVPKGSQPSPLQALRDRSSTRLFLAAALALPPLIGTTTG